MTSESNDRLEALLAEALADTEPAPPAPPAPVAPEGPHLDDGTLARLAEGRLRPTAAQRAHLVACAQCRDVLGAAAVAVPDTAPEPRRARPWTWWLAPGLAAACAAAAVVAVPFGPRGDGVVDDVAGYRARGAADQAEAATVSFLATLPDGRREVLSSGARVPLGARLGFRYGNPAKQARTLTVLGYDGAVVRWYYPQGPGKPAFEIEGGPEVVNSRLPFDIQLAQRHRPGKLTLVAAFDVSPDALAAALRAGAVPDDATRVVLEVLPE